MKFLSLIFALAMSSCARNQTVETQPLPTPSPYCFDSVYAAGDSFTANVGYGYVSYPTYLQQLIKLPVYNGGISGETSVQIAARYASHVPDTNVALIVWAGANNNWHTEEVKSDIRRMVGERKKFLVLELMCGSLPERWKGSPYYENNVKLNNELAAEYGADHFVWIKKELQQYMLNKQDSIDVLEHDAVPTSMRSDWLHHNSLANQKIAAILAERLKCK